MVKETSKLHLYLDLKPQNMIANLHGMSTVKLGSAIRSLEQALKLISHHPMKHQFMAILLLWISPVKMHKIAGETVSTTND